MAREQWRQTGRELASIQAWRTRLVFWGGAVLVGLAATLLAWASDWAGHTFTGVVDGRSWLPFVLTPAGLVLIAWLTRRFFPSAEGSGIPQVIAMLQVPDTAVRSRVLGLRVAVGKGLMIVLGLLCGASIGREGPTVHISAALSYSLVRIAHFPVHFQERGLILAGAAAGLAAAFNTPLAGIVFAIEEMSRSFEERTSGVILTAVILAGITAVSLHGNYHYFGSVDVNLPIREMLLPVLVCGLAGGALGGLFSLLLISGLGRLGRLRRAHPYLFAAGCGLSLAAIGLATAGATYGTGYEEAHHILDGNHSDPWFALAKLAATLVSYWSGIPGGIFAPTLSVGAGLGSAIGELFTDVPVSALALLCMAGYFTGAVRSPITALVIVMEMTNEHVMLLPIAGTALIAEWVSRHICAEPLYKALAQAYFERDVNQPASAPAQQADSDSSKPGR